MLCVWKTKARALNSIDEKLLYFGLILINRWIKLKKKEVKNGKKSFISMLPLVLLTPQFLFCFIFHFLIWLVRQCVFFLRLLFYSFLFAENVDQCSTFPRNFFLLLFIFFFFYFYSHSSPSITHKRRSLCTKNRGNNLKLKFDASKYRLFLCIPRFFFIFIL